MTQKQCEISETNKDNILLYEIGSRMPDRVIFKKGMRDSDHAPDWKIEYYILGFDSDYIDFFNVIWRVCHDKNY